MGRAFRVGAARPKGKRPAPIDEYAPTAHAVLGMQRRGIGEDVARKVLQGRKDSGGRIDLVRVVGNVDRTPAQV